MSADSGATSADRARWRRRDEILDGALDLSAAEREAFLSRACGDDAGLRREVEELLAADARHSGALDEPPPWRRDGAEGEEGVAESMDVAVDEAEAAAVDESGARVGAYRLVRAIGRGGMGTVYLAERADGEFAQRVALKLVRGSFLSSDVARRFRREREILATLEHPHIARLYDGGVSDDGRPYFVMEHVEGEHLLAFCDRRRLPLRDRLALFRDVCAAVSFAHANLVVHRDLKPSNILVTGDGRAKLLDFGLAKLLDPDRRGETLDVSRAGGLFLTPEYASPEQWRGEPVTTATDVYSLGVVLHELLTGRRPPPAGVAGPGATASGDTGKPSAGLGHPDERGSVELAAARGTTPERLRRALAGDLDNVVLKALRLEPGRRYPSAEALGEDVTSHLEGKPVTARPDTVAYRARKFVARHRAAVVATAAGALLVASLVVFYTARLARERDRARHAAAKAEQVSSFLLGLFQLSDPQRARGRNLTAREILDRGARQVGTALADQPAVQAEMLTLIGQVYFRLGMLGEARVVLERAVERSQAAGLDDTPVFAETLRELGQALEDVGEFDAERRRLGEAEAIFRRHGDQLGLARVLTDFGNLERWTGHYALAKRRQEEALAITPRLGPGPERESLLSRQLHDYGLVLWRLNELDASLASLERSLAIDERKYGPQSPVTAFTLATLARVRAEAGDAAGARPLAERSLAIRRQVFGAKHFQVASSLSTLGTVWSYAGSRERALDFYERSIALYTETLGPQSPDLAWPLRYRCLVLVELGRAREGLGDCRRALAIRQGAFDAEHPDVAVSTIDLARARFAAGEREGIEATTQRALVLLRRRLPPGHPRIVEAEELLGALRSAPQR